MPALSVIIVLGEAAQHDLFEAFRALNGVDQ
jgi:hypothetical protein